MFVVKSLQQFEEEVHLAAGLTCGSCGGLAGRLACRLCRRLTSRLLRWLTRGLTAWTDDNDGESCKRVTSFESLVRC